MNGWAFGMTSLAFETDEMRPVRAWCADGEVHVALADGRVIATPLWWYPFLSKLTDKQLNDIELMYEGIWWTAVDEGISVKSMFLGIKAPGAKAPEKAA
ncbi:DUF2442 domain-containing protein [Neorhizobium galegae]|uniref:DUF2442 domain-containing protein n=1 Tax=Neorhizobium galegae TaxID=399 RepID=UPI0006220304|nr:DUF2442 domain-containing protein [Neorhizobium galegae]MCQ1767337.1 DUF2442 domain-containing protein [Neorhizobium galegae]MCQ1846719.1 DUF2442 domain-containing protein [Neorhizobium galegae]CDZ35112.1 Hypothetical protein NGAL_HAMBI1146_11900 [Neorhizobium galegae bv. officinalis]